MRPTSKHSALLSNNTEVHDSKAITSEENEYYSTKGEGSIFVETIKTPEMRCTEMQYAHEGNLSPALREVIDLQSTKEDQGSPIKHGKFQLYFSNMKFGGSF